MWDVETKQVYTRLEELSRPKQTKAIVIVVDALRLVNETKLAVL